MSTNMWSQNASLSGGTLSLAGISAAQLAKDFGTPTFFLDEAAYRSRALTWHNGLQREFGPHAGTIYYAAKSLSVQLLRNGSARSELVSMSAQVANSQ